VDEEKLVHVKEELKEELKRNNIARDSLY